MKKKYLIYSIVILVILVSIFCREHIVEFLDGLLEGMTN